MRGRWDEAVREFVGDDAGRSVLVSGRRHDHQIVVAAGQDVSRPGASLLKVVVAMAAYEAGRAGTIDLHDEVAIAELPTSRWPSVLNLLGPSHRLTVQELVALSLAVSDNRSAHHLVNLVGIDAINRVAAGLGCRDTHLRVGFDDASLEDGQRTNVTTARDSALLLETISTRPDLAPMIEAMANNLNGTRIPLRLPAEVVVAHKTGSLEGVIADVGIVLTPHGAFTICFLTDGQTDGLATSTAIGTCALHCYEAWKAATP